MGYTETVLRDVTFNFVKVDEGQELLVRPDDYLTEMVNFDYRVRLQSNDPCHLDDYLQLLRNSVIEWEDEEIVVILREYEKHRHRLMRFNLDWPETIYFVKTDGSDESNVAYCRSDNIIVLSQKHIDRIVIGEPNPHVLWHELWHILSRNNPKKCEQLYRTLGFRYMKEFKIPEFLINHRVTNPDAPKFDVVMQIETEGDGPTWMAPVCYYNRDEIQDDSFFKYYVTELLVVEPVDESMKSWKARLNNDGELELINPRDCENFWEQVGENTNYINHPEEILAENFVFFMMGQEPDNPLPSPWVIERMEEILFQ